MEIFGKIGGYILSQSWQVAVVFMIVAVLCFFLRRSSAHWRYLLWLLVIVKCLTPPIFTVPLEVLPEKTAELTARVLRPADSATEPQPLVETSETQKPKTNIEATNPATISPQQADVSKINTEDTASAGHNDRVFGQLTMAQWLLAAWVGGVVVFFLYAIKKAFQFRAIIQEKRTPAPMGLQAQLATLSAELNLPTPPKLFLIDGFSQPFVWGIPRGDLYLPRDFEKTPPEQRRQIMMHELAHVQRWDTAVNSVQILVQVLFFFHPLVWLASRQIRREREKCCDEIAIATLQTHPKHFGNAILEAIMKEQTTRREVPTVAVAGPVKNLEDRIKTIMSPNKRFQSRPSILSVVTFVLLLVVTCPMAFTLIASGSGKQIIITEKETGILSTADPGDDELMILAMVDGHSLLRVCSEGIYWQHMVAVKPGLHGNQSEPTFVNGEKWFPIWQSSDPHRPEKSQLFKRQISDPTELYLHMVHSANIVDGKYVQNRGVMKSWIEGEELVASLNDYNTGPSWYCFKLKRHKTVQEKVEKPVDEAETDSPKIVKPGTVLIDFKSPKALDLFNTSFPDVWKVTNGRLVGRGIGPTQKPFLTYTKWFKKISKVVVTGKIVAGEKSPGRFRHRAENFRVSVGKINLIFNWEVAHQNHYRNGEEVTVTSGHALQANTDHTIVIQQDGPMVLVSVDGKQTYKTRAQLDGTVTVYPAHGSEISISKIEIDGVPDSDRQVQGHSHSNTY